MGECTLTWRLCPLHESGIKQECTFFVLLLALLWFYMTKAFAFYLMSRMHLSYSITSRNGCFLVLFESFQRMPFCPLFRFVCRVIHLEERFTWVCLGLAISYRCSSWNLLRIHMVCLLGHLSCSHWVPVQGPWHTGLHLLLSLVF